MAALRVHHHSLHSIVRDLKDLLKVFSSLTALVLQTSVTPELPRALTVADLAAMLTELFKVSNRLLSR